MSDLRHPCAVGRTYQPGGGRLPVARRRTRGASAYRDVFRLRCAFSTTDAVVRRAGGTQLPAVGTETAIVARVMRSSRLAIGARPVARRQR